MAYPLCVLVFARVKKEFSSLETSSVKFSVQALESSSCEPVTGLLSFTNSQKTCPSHLGKLIHFVKK